MFKKLFGKKETKSEVKLYTLVTPASRRRYEEMIGLLRNEGHSEAQIAQIVADAEAAAVERVVEEIRNQNPAAAEELKPYMNNPAELGPRLDQAYKTWLRGDYRASMDANLVRYLEVVRDRDKRNSDQPTTTGRFSAKP